MRLIIKTLIFYFLICISLQSQTNIGVDIDSDLSVASMRTYSIATFDKRDVSYKGSPLLWENWMYAYILLDGNKKFLDKEYHINYDALTNLFYVRIGNKVHDMLLSKVTSLKVMTDLNEFTVYKAIRSQNSGMGLYEVLYSDDNLELVRRTQIEVVKSFYNTALDAGDVRSRLKRDDTLFLFKADQLFELPKKRKKLVKQYKETEEIKDIVTFFKENRVDLKDEKSVQSALIEFNKN